MRLRPVCAVVVGLLLVLASTFSYDLSSLASRAILVSAYVAVLTSAAVASHKRRQTVALSSLLIASLMFLLCASSFISADFMERTLSSPFYRYAQQYGDSGHLVFSDPHSYFFLVALILRSLYDVAGVSPSASVYVLLVVYGILTAFIGMLLMKAIMRRTDPHESSSTTLIVPSLVAFSFTSFAFSQRGITAFWGLPALLLSMVMVLAFNKGFRTRSHAAIVLLLVVGVTLGSTDGILVIVPFFLLLSIWGGMDERLLYGLVPLGYLFFAGYAYMAGLLNIYGGYAWRGFLDFLSRLVLGEPWQRVLPWERTNPTTREDLIATSISYLSLMALCLVVGLVSSYLSMKSKDEGDRQNRDMRAIVRSGSSCLLLMLGIAAVTYVGASIMAEKRISDMRTIVIVFPSLLLPFLFVQRNLIRLLSRRRFLSGLMVILIVFASFRTVYETYPKSAGDPIIAAEDARLGHHSVFAAGSYLSTYYRTGKIYADGLLTIRIIRYFSTGYETHVWQGDRAPTEAFSRSSGNTILVFTLAGMKYPSTYHSYQVYVAAYNLSLTGNRIYDNGAVIVAANT